MDLLDNASTWVEGDIAQGRIMLVVGILVLFGMFLGWRNGGEMLRGMMIPLGLVVVICAGYGGFMQFNRAQHLESLAEYHMLEPEITRTNEIARISKDIKTYNMTNYVWTGLFLTGAALIILSGGSTWRGVGLGSVLLAATGFMVDNFLHARAETYLQAIQ